MSSSAPAVAGLDLLAIIKGQALTTFGPEILALLTAINNAQLDPLKIAAAWAQFLGDIQPGLIAFEVAVVAQIIAAIQSKIQLAIAAAQAPQANAGTAKVGVGTAELASVKT